MKIVGRIARGPARQRTVARRWLGTHKWRLLQRVMLGLVLLSASHGDCRAADNYPAPAAPARCERREGALIRGPTDQKRLALIFTGHEFAEGADTILDELAAHQARASFFLTGTFLTNTTFEPLVQRMVAAGHYLGPHSDRHLLYCEWDAARTTRVTRDQFASDLLNNVEKLARHGVTPAAGARWFVPPFEHSNARIAAWAEALGWSLVHFTPGTRSNADYTGEADANFVSSDAIFESIVQREREDPHGLNGFILLLHLGSGPGRRDKFHARFGDLLDGLAAKGYQFVRVDEWLANIETQADD